MSDNKAQLTVTIELVTVLEATDQLIVDKEKEDATKTIQFSVQHPRRRRK